MGVRRKAREQALQVLFGLEFNQTQSNLAVRHFNLSFAERGDPDPYLARIVLGVADNLEELNEVIRRHSTNWRLERMAIVDKNILRLASYELFHEVDVPRKVAINEAIEIAKKYGSEDSPSFVNGVLDRVALEARGEETPEASHGDDEDDAQDEADDMGELVETTQEPVEADEV